MTQGDKLVRAAITPIHEAIKTWLLYGQHTYVLLTTVSLYTARHNELPHLLLSSSPMVYFQGTNGVQLKRVFEFRKAVEQAGWLQTAEVFHIDHETHHFRFVSPDGIVLRIALHRPRQPDPVQFEILQGSQRVIYDLPDDLRPTSTLNELQQHYLQAKTGSTPRPVAGPADARDIDLT